MCRVFQLVGDHATSAIVVGLMGSRGPFSFTLIQVLLLCFASSVQIAGVSDKDW